MKISIVIKIRKIFLIFKIKFNKLKKIILKNIFILKLVTF